MPVVRNIAAFVQQLHAGDERLLMRALARHDDVQVASVLEILTPGEQDRVLQLLPIERRAEVLGSMRSEIAAGIVGRLAPEEAADLLEELDADDAVDILGLFGPAQLRQILARVDAEEAEDIEELLAYGDSTAGGLMSLDVFRVRKDTTVAEAIRMVQEAEDLPQTSFYLYVVDELGRLIGITTLRKLVTSKPDMPIHAIMDADIVHVTADTDQEKVAEIASRYDLVAIPVVDQQLRMLGVVTIDDIVDVIREEATEDILKMAGAGQELVDTRSFWSSFRARMPWLFTAAVGGLLVAVSLQGFEDALRAVPALALFMPVVAGMGGNVGTQSSTIVVRGIAVGYIEGSRIGRLLVREIALGASLGMIYGTMISVAAPFLGATADNPLGLGLVITFGMAGCMIIAAAVGTSVPLVLHRFNVDPAIATGPFVTTSVDILGLLFYFWLATITMDVTV
ncbi:MAG: magnesium transporter [Myxococcales bacterium]|nr:magnesium transporter [Myxococcales bacterium]MCB9754391.1 magnesium transporter [Myxococcales bacterium]